MVSRTIKPTPSIGFGYAQPTGHAQRTGYSLPTAFNCSLSELVLSGLVLSGVEVAEVAEGNNHAETKQW